MVLTTVNVAPDVPVAFTGRGGTDVQPQTQGMLRPVAAFRQYRKPYAQKTEAASWNVSGRTAYEARRFYGETVNNLLFVRDPDKKPDKKLQQIGLSTWRAVDANKAIAGYTFDAARQLIPLTSGFSILGANFDSGASYRMGASIGQAVNLVHPGADPAVSIVIGGNMAYAGLPAYTSWLTG